jgi:CO dehydrogenase/acetyl-CoA synthase epsilon subunit
MSLKALLRAGKELLKAKKPSATPTTGQQQRQITYTPKPSQAQASELVEQELKNPPVVLKKTKPLQMGDDLAPAFGSSTYDWAMRMGRSKYTADEWLDHLTSTRKVNFKIFGKPAQKTVREQKRFKYDSGPFAGKEVSVSKEELFDSNLAIFNEAGDLTGGLLYAAKKFGLKLDANEVGAMLKLNPINRLKPIELGVNKGAQEAFDVAAKNARNTVRDLQVKYKDNDALKYELDQLQYYLKADSGVPGRGALKDINESLKNFTNSGLVPVDEKKALNKVIGEINNKVGPMQATKTKYGTETNYTLQGGKDYRETIFTLPEDIPTNASLRNKGGHFTDVIGDTNNIYHIRYDTRFTPDGKKVFMINEIQSDVNQSIAKSLTKAQQLSGERRLNPFNADIELNLLVSQRGKMLKDLDDAVANNEFGRVNAISASMKDINTKLKRISSQRDYSSNQKDYFPMVEADSYGDHAIKYLMQKAARENVDYVAVAPFDKVSFRQGYKAGNERFYGYANGKGIGKKGKAVIPDVMARNARFYGSKAGPTKISLSDPTKPYKSVSSDTFKYPTDHPLKGKEIKSTYHNSAGMNPEKGTKNIPEGDPRLYFDAYAIKVNPLMRNTQKTYKSKGGLVVDIFKPIRYN